MQSRTIKDKGICIGARNYSETSQLVSFFTRGHGKISSIAKGSRREKGGFGGGLDVMTAGEILFVPPRGESGLATLTEFEQQDSFPALRMDLLVLNCGLCMCDLLSRFTEDMDPHPELYVTFRGKLGELQQAERPEYVIFQFELILLREIGMQPVWDICSQCRRDVEDNGRIYFSSQSGGIVCRDCEPAFTEKRLVEPIVLEALQNPERALHAPREIVVNAHELLSYHYRELAGKETAIMRFVNQLFKSHIGD